MPPRVAALLLTCSHLDTPSTCADVCIHCGDAGEERRKLGLQLTPRMHSSQAPPWWPSLTLVVSGLEGNPCVPGVF